MNVRKPPAPARAWAIYRKLAALAERGVDGERLAAERKLNRLKAKYDFDRGETTEPADLFQGHFKQSSKARWIYSFPPSEFELANAVKWAIENSTRIRCLHRDRDLLAEATPGTAERLTRIAEHITLSFRDLIATYTEASAVSLNDRGLFVLGLYDGMMGDARDVGQLLPGRPGLKKKRSRRKPGENSTAGLGFHPYTLALGLGRKIRFSVPLAEITAELENLTQRHLANTAEHLEKADLGKRDRRSTKAPYQGG